MDITKQYLEQQEAKNLQSRIFSFMKDFHIGILLNKSGIRKLKGVSPLMLFSSIFMLPFEGNNFYRGIVANEALPVRKNAAYDLLKNPRNNWRRFMLSLAVQVCHFFTRLSDEKREKVLIFDDSTYDRSRSKAVELLAWICDHNSGTSLKGFKLLTLGCSDGASFSHSILFCAPLQMLRSDSRISRRCWIREPVATGEDWKRQRNPPIILKTW